MTELQSIPKVLYLKKFCSYFQCHKIISNSMGSQRSLTNFEINMTSLIVNQSFAKMIRKKIFLIAQAFIKNISSYSDWKSSESISACLSMVEGWFASLPPVLLIICLMYCFLGLYLFKECF